MQQIRRVYTFLVCITVIFTILSFGNVFESHAANITEETYIYKGDDYPVWVHKTDPYSVPKMLVSKRYENNAFVITAVPGATYYYKRGKDSPWSKTTNLDDIREDFDSTDSNNNAFIFTVIPGATYYYKPNINQGWQSTKEPR